jgi:methyl-accepting chemotaxis protein
MKNLKIRTRLSIGFGSVLILLIFISLFTMSRMYKLAEYTSRLYAHPFTVSNALREAEINIIKMHVIMKDAMLAENSQQLAEAAAEIKRLEKFVYSNFDIVKERFLGDTRSVDALRKNFAHWRTIRDEVFALMNEGKKREAAAITKGKEVKHLEGLQEEMDVFTDFAGEKAAAFLEHAHHSEESSYGIIALIVLAAAAISIAIGYMITRSVTRPVQIAVEVAGRLAKGDIDVNIPAYSNDEMGTMLTALKNMALKLKEQIGELVEGISVLAGSTAQISSAAAQFASTTQEVATSINEVVVSMKEVKQTTELSNEKAREMVARAESAVQTSRGGEDAVQETVALIDTIQEQMIAIADRVVELSDQGQSIGEIIAAVDDVADQSRLLAVNASIEAVKAGEHGKGFTVVADEIKNLAQQSKLSTSQVRTILTDIQKATAAAVMATEKGGKAVDNGVKQSTGTGEAIRTLGESIAHTSRSALQIEATSRQQSAGIEQVFAAMENIGAAMEQSAENAAQLENSARDLNELGKKLKDIVDKYNVGRPVTRE